MNGRAAPATPDVISGTVTVVSAQQAEIAVLAPSSVPRAQRPRPAASHTGTISSPSSGSIGTICRDPVDHPQSQWMYDAFIAT